MAIQRLSTEFMLRILLGLGTLVLIAGAILLVKDPFTEPVSHFELKASESQGHVKLDWDPKSPMVREADSAILEADDGGERHKYNVNPRVLRNGGLDYNKRTTSVLLRLVLMQNGRETGKASVRLTQAAAVPQAGSVLN